MINDIHFYEGAGAIAMTAAGPRTFTTEDLPLESTTHLRLLLVRCNGHRVADAFTPTAEPAVIEQAKQLLLDLTLLHFSGG